jgi:carbon storage regulator
LKKESGPDGCHTIRGERQVAEPAQAVRDGKTSRMLILVRKAQEGIWIEGDIWVRVLSVDRDRVKLGITAPSSVKVMREEIYVAVEDAHADDEAPVA